jgi:hypothetical protein
MCNETEVGRNLIDYLYHELNENKYAMLSGLPWPKRSEVGVQTVVFISLQHLREVPTCLMHLT